LLESNQTNETNVCGTISYDGQVITSFLDLVNRQFIPSLLMICFSFMLVVAVVRSSSIVSDSINAQNRRKKNIGLAINCVFMNFVFFILNTPVSIAIFIPDLFFNKALLLSTSFIFYLAYGINFYVIFTCNSLFRREFFKILGWKVQNAQ
jgi:hypothetical protein